MKNKWYFLPLGIFALFVIAAGSVVAQPTIEDPFFDQVDYVGAFGTEDWTEGWANWDPQNTVYPVAATVIPAGDITESTTWSPSNSIVLGAQSFENSKLNDPFFEQVNYIGAFGTTDWTAGWAEWDPQNAAYPTVTDTIDAGDITEDITLTADKVYLINGWVYVKDGATITIEPGTVIRGSKANKGSLIIEKGATIIAEGSVEHPIVFTSNQDAGSRGYGDWGGIILLGSGQVNKVDPVIEGGPTSTYGGDNDADSSGVLKYVRIEFPGIAFQPDKEINGLTFGGVGNKTLVDYIQVSFSGDDSYEFFGGTVNCRHLIAFRGWDDDFDTDYGYRGLIQFGVSLKDPDVADPQSGSNCFESDNDGDGSEAEPVTAPVFSNISSFGPLATPSTTISTNHKRAMHLRRNTKLSIFNSIFAGYATGLFIDGSAAQANATDGDLAINNTFLTACKDYFAAEFDSTYFSDVTKQNEKVLSNTELGLADPFNLDEPVFTAANNAYLLDGWIYVKDGATLTIEPGTVIRGSKNNKGALIIEKGAKIIAEGTVENPIVFTSNQEPGLRGYGDWGGLIVLGKAQVNKIDPVIEGGPTSTYGGSDDEDNSGVLKYIRIEFPGIAFQPDKEINGLTLGGVGSATEMDHIQISYSGDDSYEWFGGTVSAKNLIAFRGWDDDFDTDYGFRGKIQYAVSLRDPEVADPQSGSNSFESDNDGDGSEASPVTQAVFSNVSSFGPLSTMDAEYSDFFKRGMHLRRNTKLSIYNSIFGGWPTGVFIDGSAAQGNATEGELNLRHVTLAGMNKPLSAAFDSSYFPTDTLMNSILAETADLQLADPFNLEAPDFLPEAGSPVLTGSIWYEEPPTSITDFGTEKVKAVAYPNPFAERAQIAVSMDRASHLSVKIFDVTGALVSTVVNEVRTAGTHEFAVGFTRKGVYFAEISVDSNRKVIKLVSR